jgi:riboflavin kinase/FMN adenylyltransferase
LGVETLVVLEFTEEFSRWRPEDFVGKVLADGLHAEHTVVGSNFTFGHKGVGNLAVLADLGAACGFSVEGMALLKIDGRAVSSSSIREALGAGDLQWPIQALGRRFVVDGVVVAGAGRGAELGYPTANLEVSPRMQLPAEGVYAGRAYVADATYVAAVNIGTNPTFGGEPLHVEAYLLDFEGDIRGQPIAVEFWRRLRDEKRFGSRQALAAQIAADVQQTRTLFAQQGGD